MAIREIVKYPNPILNRSSQGVGEVTEEIRQLARDMTETQRANQGAGLAAPQINISKRIITVQLKDGPRAFLNPEIVERSKETEVGEEGCLCLPGVYLKIKRAKQVKIAAQDLEGRNIEIKTEGLQARIFQHEIDHLNGILILDNLPFLQKWKLKAKLKNK